VEATIAGCRWGDRLGRTYPTFLALMLATVSWPIVALSLDLFVLGPAAPGSSSPVVHSLGFFDLGRWVAAAGSIFSSALVAGTFCAPVARRHQVLGGLVTVTLAWIVAVFAAPVLPWLMGLSIGFDFTCLDTCGALFDSGSGKAIANGPGSALAAAFWFWLGPTREPVSFATLLMGVVVWVRWLCFGFTIRPRVLFGRASSRASAAGRGIGIGRG
jgi:hypothetical protein